MKGFIKVNPERHRTPERVRAGWWACRVFELLCDVCAVHGSAEGVLPKEYLDAEWLAAEWGLGDMDVPHSFSPTQGPSAINAAIARLASGRVRLLEHLPDGSVRLKGFTEAFHPRAKTNAERQRAWRLRKEAAP